MRANLCFVIFVILIAFAAGESYIPNAKHPTKSKTCLHRGLNVAIPVGQSHSPMGREGYCNKFHCREDYVIEVSDCSRYQVGDGCEVIPTDYSKQFPRCCAHPVCIDNEIGLDGR